MPLDSTKTAGNTTQPTSFFNQNDPDYLAAIIFPALMFLSGFVSYMLYHDYDLLAHEVLVIYAWLGAAGLGIGLLLAKIGPTNLRAFIIGLLLLVYIDVHTDLARTVPSFLQENGWWPLRYAVFFFGYFVVFLIILNLRKRLASIAVAVFTTLLVSTVVLPTEKVDFGQREIPRLKAPKSGLPPIIHLVLDGHIGIEGIPGDIEGGLELRRKLTEFYKHWGFRVYGRAYSKYFLTRDSLSNMFNGVASGNEASLLSETSRNGRSVTLNQNLYFQRAAAKGYRSRIYQSDYIDFCMGTENLESCYVYASASPQLVEKIEIPLTEKAELILGSYVSNSGIYHTLEAAYRKVRSGLGFLYPAGLSPKERKYFEFSSIGVPPVLRLIASDILDASEGRLFFAHLLMPHGPYVWDRKCQIRTDTGSWLARRREHQDVLSTSNPEYRRTAYRYYFDQTHCLVSLLDRFLKLLDQQELLEEATIIIHGDHGSRITIADPVDSGTTNATTRDLIDSFSSLLAIRSPSLDPGYELDMRSIQSLFAEHILDQSPMEEDGKIRLLRDYRIMSKEMVPVPMPQF